MNVTRAAFLTAGAASLIMGYIGFGRLLAGSGEHRHHPLDLVYYDLQLFVLGADPLQQNRIELDWSLQTARFTAPAITAYAIVEAARLLFAVQLGRWRARRAHGHTIICGPSPVSEALSRRLQAQDVTVIEVRPDIDESSQPGDPLRVVGDPRDPRVLRAAGVEHASYLYACAESSATNAAIALATGRARVARAETLEVHTHIPDADLCATFQASHLGQASPGDLRLDFFNVDQIAARKLFTDHPPQPLNGRAPRLLVAGAGAFGCAVTVEAARVWRVTDPPPRQPLPVVLVGRGARTAVDDLERRFPFLQEVCRFTAFESDLLDLLAEGRLRPPPDRIVICYEDEEYALKTGITAERLWRGTTRSIVVRLDGLAPLLDGERNAPHLRMFDVNSGALRVLGAVHTASDPDLIREDLIERLARVLHDRYRVARSRRGDVSVDDPAMVPWERLSSHLRLMNRKQAEDIGRKLSEVACVVVPRIGPDLDEALFETEIEMLAKLEHERWCEAHYRAGWQYAPRRDDELRLHPGLVPWVRLPENFRQRCHDSISELSLVLADAGFRIARA